VNSTRYTAYRRALFRIETTSRLNQAEQALLKDCAEGLLLSRPGEESDAQDLREGAAVALGMLAGQARLADADADDIWDQLSASGPGAEGAPEGRPHSARSSRRRAASGLGAGQSRP
jgi:hypothetical protein